MQCELKALYLQISDPTAHTIFGVSCTYINRANRYYWWLHWGKLLETESRQGQAYAQLLLGNGHWALMHMYAGTDRVIITSNYCGYYDINVDAKCRRRWYRTLCNLNAGVLL